MHNRETIKSLPSSSFRWSGRKGEDKLVCPRALEQGTSRRTQTVQTLQTVRVAPVTLVFASLALTIVLALVLVLPALGHPVTYHPDPTVLPPCRLASISPPGTCWVPDLTEDGVEPNPGPGTVKAKGKKKSIPMPSLPAKVKAVLKAAKTVRSGPTFKQQGVTGRSVGSAVGGWVGDMAQKAIMAITGFGDYRVSSNTLTNGGSPPAFAAGKHMTKFCHREFVGLVTSPGSAFTLSQYAISPKSSLFPWLSEIALSFEQFVIRGMVVEFKSTSATAVASTNTALGSVIIATQYNVLAPPFATQQQMEAYEYCTSCAPSVSMIHPIECAPSLTSISELYMDSGTTGAGGDPRLEYLGTTYVATVGQQAASTIGELWVSYEIDLIRPKLFSGIASAGLGVHFSTASSSVSLPAGLQPVQPFLGLSPLPGGDLPVVLGGPNGNLFTFPGWVSGTFQISIILDIGFQSASWDFTGQGSLTLVSGAGQVVNYFTAFPANPGVLQCPVSGSVTSGAAFLNVSLTGYIRMTGNTPSVPTIFSMSGFAGSTGGSITVGGELYVLQVSIAS